MVNSEEKAIKYAEEAIAADIAKHNKKATFDDMQKWAEDAYKTDINGIPAFIDNIISEFKLESIQKINLVVVAVSALLKNFYENRLFNMTEQEVEQSKWVILKSIFSNIGDGPISIMKWNNLLLPSSDAYFHSITADVFSDIQDSAKLLVERHESGKQKFSDVEVEHWKSIIAGNVPFGYTIIKKDEAPTEEV